MGRHRHGGRTHFQLGQAPPRGPQLLPRPLLHGYARRHLPRRHRHPQRFRLGEWPQRRPRLVRRPHPLPLHPAPVGSPKATTKSSPSTFSPTNPPSNPPPRRNRAPAPRATKSPLRSNQKLYAAASTPSTSNPPSISTEAHLSRPIQQSAPIRALAPTQLTEGFDGTGMYCLSSTRFSTGSIHTIGHGLATRH